MLQMLSLQAMIRDSRLQVRGTVSSPAVRYSRADIALHTICRKAASK